MRPGEQFELRCYEHLRRHYKTKEIDFRHDGGMDSTKSDIAVVKDGKIDFYIEAKDSVAQSGQFVVLPDKNRGVFVFSPHNHSEPNEMTDTIIEYMSSDFRRFNNAGTAGQTLDIDTTVFADWIIAYYKDKNVRYVISCDQDYVIFPIRKFKQYFDIVAKYRIKKSGSKNPAQKDIAGIKQEIKKCYTAARFSQEKNKLYVDVPERIHKDRFRLGDYTYYLSVRNSGSYEVRRLSNTYNMNVIFSVKLIRTQDEADLKEFESEL